MKKEKIYKLFYIISILLSITFIIFLTIDYLNYNPITYSTPFYTFIIIRIIELLIPSIILFLIGKIIKNKIK